MDQQLMDAFAEAYAVRAAAGGRPSGVRVSPDLWRSLKAAGMIDMVPAQIRFSGSPSLERLQPLPVDLELPTYRGTIVHVEPALGDVTNFEFSPR